MSVLAAIGGWAERVPDRMACVFLDSKGRQSQRYTYGGLWDRVNLLASRLHHDLGLRAGDRVLLAYPPGLEMIATFFACARIGVISAPVAPPSAHGFQAAQARIARIRTDCDARFVLSNNSCAEFVLDRAARERDLRSKTDFEACWVATDLFSERGGRIAAAPTAEILFLQYTSGSTNSPKGVMVSNANILANARLVLDHDDPVAVTWLPHYHDMGLIGYYINTLIGGGLLYAFSPTSFIQRPLLWLETISKYRGTASSAPNFAFEQCLNPARAPDAALADLDLSSLKFLMAAAEPIRPDVYRGFLARFTPYGLPAEAFMVAYGLAENTLAVSSYGRGVGRFDAEALKGGHAAPPADAGADATELMSCGVPLETNRVAIVDPGREVRLADGTVGEVWVAGPSKCSGYWNNPGLSATTFQAQMRDADDPRKIWLRTGDMGFLGEGELFICGRRKDMIIVRGQNYYPQDIEAVVEESSEAFRRGSVAAFEVTSRQGVTVAVVAEAASPQAKVDLRAAAERVRERLNLDIDELVLAAPRSLAKTTSGKLMRFQAKTMWQEGAFEVLDIYRRLKLSTPISTPAVPFSVLVLKYGFTGQERATLAEAGVDSLDLVLCAHDLTELLERHGFAEVAAALDLAVLQDVMIADLFEFAERLEIEPQAALAGVPRLAAAVLDTV